MLDYTTDIPQRNTVPLWNLYASTTVQSYRCGMSKIQQRDTVPLWNIQDSTTVPQYRCGILDIPQRYSDPLLDLAAAKAQTRRGQTFPQRYTVPLWERYEVRHLAAAKLMSRRGESIPQRDSNPLWKFFTTFRRGDG